MEEDLIKHLLRVPIINDFDYPENINRELLDKYIKENKSKKGILLIRRYYGIVAKKI